MKKAKKKQSSLFEQGFTLVEFLLVFSVLAIVAALAVPALRGFQGETDLSNSSGEIKGILRLARNKTIASEDQSTYGVFFDDTAVPHQYTLFKGSTYASRTPSYDEVHLLPASAEMFSINFSGGKEVVFDRISGTTLKPGELSVRLVKDPTKTTTIYVQDSGKITSVSPSAASDTGRIKDSRHVHVDYVGRVINTSTARLMLTFSTATTQIVVADNMVGGQIYWEGEVSDAGEIQKIKIHTHWLNDGLATRFSVHRDRRFNTKPLTIDIIDSPDLGSIIQYAADGITTQGTSIYVSAPNLQ